MIEIIVTPSHTKLDIDRWCRANLMPSQYRLLPRRSINYAKIHAKLKEQHTRRKFYSPQAVVARYRFPDRRPYLYVNGVADVVAMMFGHQPWPENRPKKGKKTRKHGVA